VALRNELLSLRKLRHPNIVAYLTAYACPTYLAIVTEHVLWMDWQPKTLHAWLTGEHPSGVSEGEAQGIFAQLLCAVVHAHSHSILHRDINPNNVLLQLQGGTRSVVKLCDFGSSKECVHTMPRTFRSTAPNFTAPEVLRARHMAAARQPFTITNKGAIDVWALGVILLTLLQGSAPFSASTKELSLDMSDSLERHKTLVPVMHRVLASPAVAGKISDACRALLLRIFVDDPEARPSAAALANDPWVQAAGYVPNSDYVDAIYGAYGAQPQHEFDAVLSGVCGGAGPVPMETRAAPPGFVVDAWGRVINL
jgi:serine/threonine protein kinase